MASFRGQEIFPMMSGDVPRHTRKVLRKKSEIFFFEILTLVGKFRDSSYRSWTNYTNCVDLGDVIFHARVHQVSVLLTLASLCFLLASAALFTLVPSLRRPRTRLHVNMFVSLALSNITWLLW